MEQRISGIPQYSYRLAKSVLRCCICLPIKLPLLKRISMFSVWETMNTNNGNLNISKCLSEVCLMVIWYPCLFSRALFLRHMAEGRFKWHLTLSRIVAIDPFPWLLWFSQWRNWRLIELKESFLDWKKIGMGSMQLINRHDWKGNKNVLSDTLAWNSKRLMNS